MMTAIPQRLISPKIIDFLGLNPALAYCNLNPKNPTHIKAIYEKLHLLDLNTAEASAAINELIRRRYIYIAGNFIHKCETYSEILYKSSVETSELYLLCKELNNSIINLKESILKIKLTPPMLEVYKNKTLVTGLNIEKIGNIDFRCNLYSAAWLFKSEGLDYFTPEYVDELKTRLWDMSFEDPKYGDHIQDCALEVLNKVKANLPQVSRR